MADDAQLLLDFLEDEWDSANTDGLTPEFRQIVDIDAKRYQTNVNKDLILMQVPTLPQSPAGIGNVAKVREFFANIDIRVIGITNKAHFLKVYNEVVRIIDQNMTAPPSGWQQMDCDTAHQDMSDKNKGLWRKIIPVRMQNFNVAR